MNMYREDISFDASSGELKINGKANMPFNKEIWMPDGDTGGTPSAEVMESNGPELADSEYLKFFKRKLYKQSRLPLSRFDDDNQPSWGGTDPTQYYRDELNCARYVSYLRNIFGQIIIKPLQIQLMLDIPELQLDRRVRDAICVLWNSYSVFEEMVELELATKRAESIETMKNALVDEDADGNEVKFFSSEFLVKKYLKYSNADLKENKKLKQQEDELRKQNTPPQED